MDPIQLSFRFLVIIRKQFRYDNALLRGMDICSRGCGNQVELLICIEIQVLQEELEAYDGVPAGKYTAGLGQVCSHQKD